MPNRFAFERQSIEQWQSDDELLLHLKANLNLTITGHPEFRYTVRTNADGLRDDPFDGPQEIAAVGDSFTFGLGVENDQSWPQRLEAISGHSVANLGWAGWNSYVYPAALRRHAVPLQSHIWLWAFFANDLPESTGAESFITSGRTDYKAEAERDSELPLPLQLRTVQLLAVLAQPDLALLANSGQPFERGSLKMRISDYPWRMTDPADPEVQRGWQLTEDALAETAQLAAENDAQVMVIFIPAREQVYWPEIADVMSDFDVAQLDDTATHLGEIANANGFAYLNLLDGFRAQAESGEMLYFPSDGHWNVAGHELAAQLIEDALQAHDWLGS
ncbi:MAG: SGNH/GDSL hydrolase family protein [Anaerolineae bacterium]|nr:SGNH/GDSL hydrolase family protein [Anaerolineae bacterium]